MGPNLTLGSSASIALVVQKLNATMDAVRAIVERSDTVVAGRGLRASSHSGLTTIHLGDVKGRGGGGGTVSATYPFDVTAIDTANGLVTVKRGTMNGMFPTNSGVKLPYVKDTDRYLVLNVATYQGVATQCTLALVEQAPGPIPAAWGYPPASFSLTLGAILGNTWYRTFGPGSVAIKSVEVVRVPKVSPAPGEFPVNILYSWLPSLA